MRGPKLNLNHEQKEAIKILQSSENIFLTGAAGSGKSYTLRQFLKEPIQRGYFPILASTGAAAILVGGRTFHSFFGLGILEGGISATVERAVQNKNLNRRLKNTPGVIIDEVSMLSGKTLSAAEMIARKIRGNSSPWGGMRVIAVGDFAQLPPVNPYGSEKDWAFMDEVWEASQFVPVILTQVMRTTDPVFLQVLNYIREGIVNEPVRKFLSERTRAPSANFQGTRLFARREEVERYNLNCLSKLKSSVHTFQTQYQGKEAEIEKFKKNSPIGDVIQLKMGALVMLRQNDPDGDWVNGSLGHITQITDHELSIELLEGDKIRVKPVEFTLLNADGNPVVTAKNFPVSLAWAVTIHKAQGTTLDKALLNLKYLWEPGQAYVALSRLKSSDGLFLEGWSPSSIITDPLVSNFHARLVNWYRNYTGAKSIIPSAKTDLCSASSSR